MIVWLFYTGGVFAAYRLHRKTGQGRFWSSFDALAWPDGLGYGICRKFYVNSDWMDK